MQKVKTFRIWLAAVLVMLGLLSAIPLTWSLVSAISGEQMAVSIGYWISGIQPPLPESMPDDPGSGTLPADSATQAPGPGTEATPSPPTTTPYQPDPSSTPYPPIQPTKSTEQGSPTPGVGRPPGETPVQWVRVDDFAGHSRPPDAGINLPLPEASPVSEPERPACVYPLEYWAADQDAWLVKEFRFGSQRFTLRQALRAMRSPQPDNPAWWLLTQAIVVQLNGANGAPADELTQRLVRSERWLAANLSAPQISSQAWEKGFSLAETLYSFNTGRSDRPVCSDWTEKPAEFPETYPAQPVLPAAPPANPAVRPTIEPSPPSERRLP